MDSRKSGFRRPEDILGIGSFLNLKVVLDVSHAYDADPGGFLARKFLESMKEKIVEVHLSGSECGHRPVFETRQTEFVKEAFSAGTPVIVESILSPGNILREKEYILDVLK